MLKTIKPDSELYDGETGAKLYPPSKESETRVITLLK